MGRKTSYNQIPDRELVLRSQKGDRKAFGLLVERYEDRIFNTAYRLLSNYEDAKDITQEAFLASYRFLRSFKRKSNFYTWLYRIAIRLSYRRLRGRKKTYPLEEGFLLPDEVFRVQGNKTPRQSAIYRELQETVQKALNSLDKKYRSVIVLHDFEELSYKEISDILKCPVGTVMSRLHRARSMLRKKLKDIKL